MKTHYIIIFILILINNLLFSVSLGGRVVLDPRDPYFNFARQSIIITDASNTFGSVMVSSPGKFILPNTVTDNKPHGYSITITETPNNNSFICSISDNQVTGMVYMKEALWTKLYALFSSYIVKCWKKLYLALVNKYTKPDLGDLLDTT